VCVNGRKWYLTKTGGIEDVGGALSFAILDLNPEFVMGSPLSESERFGGATGPDERRHRRRIGRTLAFGMHEVTMSQFLRFRPDYEVNWNVSQELDAAVNNIVWFDAAAFCNWLSEQEGLPESEWCFQPDDNGNAGVMRVKPDYLSLQGYRFPTEAEWEFVCRSGTHTSRYFGATDRLLSSYAWYSKNSNERAMTKASRLRPNDSGIFGLYGNAAEWTMSLPLVHVFEKSSLLDLEEFNLAADAESRGLRGGSFLSHANYLRSATRYGNPPNYRDINSGLRVVRRMDLRR
jgi:formylglycine-generating enzyme required for sulfatase activity